MKVGIIGLGQMGSGMAMSLLKAGHSVIVYNRTPAKAEPLAMLGASVVTAPGDACRGDAVFTMLANDEAVTDVVFSKAGVIDSLARGAVHISSSTISVALSQRLTDAHARKGQLFVSAPVLGRPEVAAAGQLAVITAGTDDAIDRARPFMEAIGQKLFVISTTPKDANLIKLSGNFLIACVIESLGEALALIGKAGLDRRQYVEILTSTLFDAPAYKTYGALIAQEKFEPAGFAAPLGQKDIRLTLAAAEDLKVPMPMANLLKDRFLRLIATGGAALDWAAIGSIASQDAGIRPSGGRRSS
ncbi:3-hydroxyisobutyrate dehydrogenase-like beta-hydroxyacid dehydrogenase [Mesorhizobium soli]|uniref:NAD(P)-dependent oxidoreductase n=1 Tax=Pseudaminobacter soli (ex Li et al. 2025) TaxID=1295366 RepID=UPI0024769A00|nr:NAD(P)-dependent oxidoreductase [Mesorhizobium soli]MDH6232955.1 3-hydroxyisobutyrate dehydrogenase-like beta-hydroxyacid dehydrogenase [Mesorhizobium soli]